MRADFASNCDTPPNVDKIDIVTRTIDMSTAIAPAIEHRCYASAAIARNPHNI